MAFPPTLAELYVTQIVVTGIATSTVVESTERAAHELGYHIALVTDAMTDRDAALRHSSTMKIFPKLAETGCTVDMLALVHQHNWAPG